MTFSKSWLLLIIFWMAQLHGQEFVRPIHQNPEKSPELLQEHQNMVQTRSGETGLPFWDDFTNDGPYPDPDKWDDSYVFINKGFAVHPKTFGVATFDVLDDEGRIYDHATIDNIPFAADHLTSRIMDLSDHNPSDSLILSFYYQPQGTGAPPADNDSLVLQFRLPPGNDNDDDDRSSKEDNNDDDEENGDDEHMWQSIWKAEGEKLLEFSQDTFPYFKRVAIPLTDEKFFHEEFQFRYRNYASFSPGQTIPNNTKNGNIWNLDYVYLDSNRSLLDSTYDDIAFASQAQSLLQDLTAMPWSQYIHNPQQVLRSNFQVRITNLDDAPYNYNYRYIIRDEDQNTIRTYSGGTDVVDPFYESGYQNYPPHSNPIVLTNPLPTEPAQQREFQVVHTLEPGGDGDQFPRNDTITYDQVFSDYFAYDDGVPELIHLISGTDPVRALHYRAEHADTLEAVKIFMLETINNQDFQQSYEIIIWDSLEPENIVYQSEPQVITDDDEYTQTGFVEYPLTGLVIVEGDFYVGFRQTGTVLLSQAIVVGFDKSNNVSHRLYYDVGDGQGWLSSGESGALMIRPVMKRDHVTGVDDVDIADGGAALAYPNPSRGNQLYINPGQAFAASDHAMMELFDARGRLVLSEKLAPSLNVSSLQNGVYLLRIIDSQSGNSQTERVIIAR